MFGDHDVKPGRLRAHPGPGCFVAGMNAGSFPASRRPVVQRPGFRRPQRLTRRPAPAPTSSAPTATATTTPCEDSSTGSSAPSTAASAVQPACSIGQPEAAMRGDERVAVGQDSRKSLSPIRAGNQHFRCCEMWSGAGSNRRPSAFQVNRAKRCADLRKRTPPTSGTALGGRCEIHATRLNTLRPPGKAATPPRPWAKGLCPRIKPKQSRMPSAPLPPRR